MCREAIPFPLDVWRVAGGSCFGAAVRFRSATCGSAGGACGDDIHRVGSTPIGVRRITISGD